MALVRSMAPVCQRELEKDQRRNGSRKNPAPSPLQRALKQEQSTFSWQELSLTPPGNSIAERRESDWSGNQIGTPCAINRAGIAGGVFLTARTSANQMRGVSDPDAAGGVVPNLATS